MPNGDGGQHLNLSRPLSRSVVEFLRFASRRDENDDDDDDDYCDDILSSLDYQPDALSLSFARWLARPALFPIVRLAPLWRGQAHGL